MSRATEEGGMRLSVNRKKVLKTLWVRNREGETIRRRCGLITVKRSGHRIITSGPHRRREEGGGERWEEAKQSKVAKRETLHRKQNQLMNNTALNIIAYADCSSYENMAIHANCPSKEMPCHDSWLELQGGGVSEG